MPDAAAPSIGESREIEVDRRYNISNLRTVALLITLVFVSIFCQVDRILPFILAESIKEELFLSDTQIGLMTGLAFAVCYTLLSLPIARLADQGSPRQPLFSPGVGFGVSQEA